MHEPSCSTEGNFIISQFFFWLSWMYYIFNSILISTDLSNHGAGINLYLVVWVSLNAPLSLTSHVVKIENTDQLAASEMLCKEGCHVLDLAVALEALLVDVVLDPCLSALVSWKSKLKKLESHRWKRQINTILLALNKTN